MLEFDLEMESLDLEVTPKNISVAILRLAFRRRMEYHIMNSFLQVLIH